MRKKNKRKFYWFLVNAEIASNQVNERLIEWIQNDANDRNLHTDHFSTEVLSHYFITDFFFKSDKSIKRINEKKIQQQIQWIWKNYEMREKKTRKKSTWNSLNFTHQKISMTESNRFEITRLSWAGCTKLVYKNINMYVT